MKDRKYVCSDSPIILVFHSIQINIYPEICGILETLLLQSNGDNDNVYSQN